MFPGVDGFHWTFGHVFFVCAFMAVLTCIASSVAVAFARVKTAVSAERAEGLRWESDFKDLPSRARRCRHELTGEIMHRECPNSFDCRRCTHHPYFKQAVPGSEKDEYFGLHYPRERFYHRGHTWVELQPDGTALVGLDEFANRVIGRAEVVHLPAPGSRVVNNGTAWRMERDGAEVRVLAPLDGEVTAIGGPDDGWYLRVGPLPSPPDLRHLLHGSEVEAWIRRELERLQLLVTQPCAEPALADGGELGENVIESCPLPHRDLIIGAVLLDP